jgi:hypothetical protein
MGVLDYAHGNSTHERFDVLPHAGIKPSYHLGEKNAASEKRAGKRRFAFATPDESAVAAGSGS